MIIPCKVIVYVPVWDMRCPLDQSSDDSSQCEQTLVDVTSLPGSLVHSTRPTNVLTTSKINLCM